MDPAIATIIGAVVGALITGIAAYYFSIRLGRRHDFNKAAATFRSVFTDELRQLNDYVTLPEDINDEAILEMLKSSRTKYENAFIQFKPYLGSSKKDSFEKAWQDFCYPQGGNPKQMPGPFYEYFIDLPKTDAVNLVIIKINGLLEFAKPK